MTNPHDRLIRETLQDKEDAISFFKNSLPGNWRKMEGKIRDFKFSYIQRDIRSIDFLYVFLEFVLPSNYWIGSCKSKRIQKHDTI
ncbi:Rpn family recombination-promoting nuclease/putative transposase [Leptospira interrogans]|nr:Rpn family recombination-promoting nuclease/putative transposase [Leptospira interrogans]MCH1887149.1 Rpn family recombination-promoting nuclease/putative transposase [Leptospira interrogans]